MKYDTNLASEYYVLSSLFRLGYEAFITLGNKKAVDIIVKLGERQITIDVKGLQGKTSFPIDNCDTIVNPNHYIVFVSFLNEISNLKRIPEMYVVPSVKIEELTYHNPKGTRRLVQLGTLRKDGHDYQDNWDILKQQFRVRNVR